MLSTTGEVVPEKLKGIKMSANRKDIQARHLVAVFFALISGVSAVSTAVLPGVVH